MLKRGTSLGLLLLLLLLFLLLASFNVSASHGGDACAVANADVCTYGTWNCWLDHFFCYCDGTSQTCTANIGSGQCSGLESYFYVLCGTGGCEYPSTACTDPGCSGDNYIDGYCPSPFAGGCETQDLGCSNSCCSSGYSCQGSPATCQLIPPQCIDNDGDGYGTNCPAGSDCNDNNNLLTNNCNVCGNNVYESGNDESCDWGTDNGVWKNNGWISCGSYSDAEKRYGCSTSCQFEYEQDSCAYCGDGVVNGPEACEDSSTTISGCSACYQKTCVAASCAWGSCALVPGANDDADSYLDTSCGGTDCNDNDATKWQLLSGYTDSDSDGYGAGSVQSVCSGSSLPSGYSSVGGDCNNANGNIYPGSCEPAAITWSDVCDESTAGGCGSGVCTRDTGEGTTSCGGSSLNCNAGDSKFCSGGNIWADTDYDPSCLRYCYGGSCEASCDPGSCDTALWQTCDTCSGELSPSYLAADTVVDYGNCQAGQTSCPSTSISDVCSGSSLTEYYCSGASAASTTFDCNSYDYQCSGTCGTGVNSCVGLDYGCSGGGNGYCSPSASVDLDTSSSWCGGCGAQGTAWGIGGEIAATTCCGDDSSEHNLFRDCAGTACVDNPSDKGCCDVSTDCVFNDQCFSDVGKAMLLVESPTADCKNLNNKNACESGVAKKECVWNAALGKCTVSRASVQALGTGNLSAYADVDGDGADEVCVASSPGQWQETSGTISGTVKNTSNVVVQGAVVKVLGTGLSATTAADGTYSIGSVPSKAHDVVASKSEYDASTVFGVFVPDGGAATADFKLVRALGNCEDDCTKVGSNLCDATCHGKGLCWFDSDATKAACDGTFGLTEMPGGTQYVDCCMGRAYTPLKAQASVPSKNVVVTKRPVLYKGKFVNMVMVVFIP